MTHQDKWQEVLVTLKSAVMGFIKHQQSSPEQIGEAVKRFALFVEGNKGWLQNSPTAHDVVNAFNNSFASDLDPPLLSLPLDQAQKRIENLMDTIDRAVSEEFVWTEFPRR